jgi:putative transposase
MVEWEEAELPVKTQAELLNLNRSSLYYKPVPPSEEEIIIKHKIDRIYTAYPFMGSRRIAVMLKQEGVQINRKAVKRHMQEMCIQGIHPGPNLSKRNLQNRIYPYLLRGLVVEHPNQVWAIDITYIRLKSGWMYLVAIIDMFSRYVIAWELDQSMEIDFVLRTVEMALRKGKPEIMNSDQGSHFTSLQYIELLKAAEVRISMDGRGRAKDNIFIERFWRSLKYEDVYIKDYETPREVRKGINNWLNFYNDYRPHQSLEYQTPTGVYFQTKEELPISQETNGSILAMIAPDILAINSCTEYEQGAEY